MSSKTSYPVATITNNLKHDVDIYDVFNPDSSTPGPMTYTFLVTVPQGTISQQVPTIRKASQLQATRTGNISALNNDYYQQFPVDVMSVFSFAPSKAFTLTSDMRQAMENTFLFLKYVQANPSSQMATNFRTALGKTNQTKAVNTFFQGTVSFKKCTLTTWTAVSAWQTQFTNPWQGLYYLYSLGGSTSSSAGNNSSSIGTTSSTTGSTTGSTDGSTDGSTNGSTAVSPAPTLVATLSITANTGEDTAVLTMADTNNENTSLVMAGDSTMQEQNAGTGSLAVSLTPTWMNITQTSQLNGKPVVSYVIAAAFTGTINGVQVAGNPNKLPSKKTPNPILKGLADFFKVQSLDKLIGELTSIGMLYYMAKSHKEAEIQRKLDAQEKATSESDAKAKAAAVEAKYQAEDIPLVNIQLAEVQTNVSNADDAYKQVDQATDLQNKQSAVAEETKKLTDLMNNAPPSNATEEAAGILGEAEEALQKALDPNASAADHEEAVTKLNNILNKASTKINKAVQEEGSQIQGEVKDTLEKTANAMQEAQEQGEAIEKNQEQQKEKNEQKSDNEAKEGKSDDADPVKGGEL